MVYYSNIFSIIFADNYSHSGDLIDQNILTYFYLFNTCALNNGICGFWGSKLTVLYTKSDWSQDHLQPN